MLWSCRDKHIRNQKHKSQKEHLVRLKIQTALNIHK